MISFRTAFTGLLLRLRLLPKRLRNIVPPIPLPIGGLWLFGVPVKRAFTRYESDATSFLRQSIKAGDTFIDIGANLGYYTVLAAKLGARVVAYEPDAQAFRLLKKNILLHRLKNVTAHNVAVSDVEGQSDFFVKAPGSSFNSLMPVVNGVTVSVQTVRCEVPFDICKIDVEGAELKVLGGLTHKGRILVELAPAVLRALGMTEAAYLSALRGRGYLIADLTDPAKTDDEIVAQARRRGHVELLLTPAAN